MSANLYERFRALVLDETRPCMILPGVRMLSYAELDSRSGQYANALRDLGVEPGDRVAVQADKSA